VKEYGYSPLELPISEESLCRAIKLLYDSTARKPRLIWTYDEHGRLGEPHVVGMDLEETE
jgi:hypothetical protein